MRRLAVGRGDIFNDAAITVFTYNTFTRLSGEPLIEALLNAFNPLTVNVSKTDEVSSHFSGRIVTAGFFAQVDTWQLQFFDVVSHVRVYLTRQIDEAPFRVSVNAGSQLIEREIQRG